MSYKSLREEVLSRYYPNQEEIDEVNERYTELSEFIEMRFGLETHFAGSASRGTCMSGDKDIDIFVLFPEGTDQEKLKEKGLEIGKAVFDEFNGSFEIDYAEHPYTKGEIKDHEVEIVPCIDTDPESITSSVDRTPHHSRWVQENLDTEQRKDVVMLKKFLKANGIYGSSLKIEGFSGYLCEVLIGHFGSFEKLVEAAENWDETELIDPEKHHDKLSDRLEKKFSSENLRVIDPVDSDRNVASVLSKQNYARFIHLCWRFNNSPEIGFFEQEDIDYTEFDIKQELKRRDTFLVLEFDAIDEVDDIVYPQMRKTLRRIESELKKRDFHVFTSGFHADDKVRIFFELDMELPDIRTQKGPKVFHGTDHLEQFSSKYENVYVEEDRLVAKTEREFSDAKEFLKNFLDSDLESKGVPENIAEKLLDYSFIDPLDGGDKWFNYLGQKLHVRKQ